MWPREVHGVRRALQQDDCQSFLEYLQSFSLPDHINDTCNADIQLIGLSLLWIATRGPYW